MSEIIIDGVDISECFYFHGGSCTSEECKRSSDCYYKQLKRLEQGNKKWEEYATYYLDKFIELKQALKEIREILESAYKTIDYLLGQEYTDLVDNIQRKIDEVLKCVK